MVSPLILLHLGICSTRPCQAVGQSVMDGTGIEFFFSLEITIDLHFASFSIKLLTKTQLEFIVNVCGECST